MSAAGVPRPSPEEATIRVTGTLTGSAGNRWGRLIRDVAERSPRRLVLDLSDTPRIDETALVMLLQVHRVLERSDGWLVLHAPRPAVRDMLKLGRIDSVLHIDDASPGPVRRGPRAGPG